MPNKKFWFAAILAVAVSSNFAAVQTYWSNYLTTSSHNKPENNYENIQKGIVQRGRGDNSTTTETNHLFGEENRTRTTIDVVIAHYKEWESLEQLPSWTDSDKLNRMSTTSGDVHYSVLPLYQRIDPSKPMFVPNYGYEAGIYIRYIVDHYNNLPDLVVFTQADACGVDMNDALSKLTIELVRDKADGYLPLNHQIVKNRGFEVWGKTYRLRMEQCFRRIASDFGSDVFQNLTYYSNEPGYDPSTGFRVNIVCCACFVVTAERIIEAAPLDVWRDFYERAIVKGECIPGRPDLNRGKEETGGAWEHMWHILFGKDALWEPAGLKNLLAAEFWKTSEVVTGVFNRSSGWTGTDHEEGGAFCKTVGPSLSMCSYQSYCPHGTLFEGIKHDHQTQKEQYAPMSSQGQPVWVSVGTNNPCLQRGSVDELSDSKVDIIMCCDNGVG